jgi:transposase
MANKQRSRPVEGVQRKRGVKLKQQDATLGLDVVNAQAAGIDVGNEEHWVAVPPRLDGEPVRRFGCFTRERKGMAEWLKRLGIKTVAMQSTGVYWMALYEILEACGIEVYLVNARDTKNLPGRKTDIQECQWLMKLHVYGLLRNSFRAAGEIRVMRSYWRQRQQHIANGAQCTQRLQKALQEMNVQITNVISDVNGVTGRAIVGAILAGQRDPQQLAELCQPGIQAGKETVAQSLEGNWKEELLFNLRQESELYEEYERRVRECDEQLARHFASLPAQGDPQKLPVVRREKRARGNVPENMDLRKELYRITGVDLTAIDGVNVLTAHTILSEVGADMKKFESEGHFVSWLGLSPSNQISGGKVVGRDKSKKMSRSGRALRLAASSLLRSESYLGAQYRRLRSKLGAPKAMKAMAGRLARIIYRMLKYGEDYVDKGDTFYTEKYKQQQIRMLNQKAAKLGLQVIAA